MVTKNSQRGAHRRASKRTQWGDMGHGQCGRSPGKLYAVPVNRLQLFSEMGCHEDRGQHLLAWFGKETRLSRILGSVLETVLGDGTARGLVSLLHSEKNEKGRADKRGHEAAQGPGKSGTLGSSPYSLSPRELCVLACIIWNHPNILQAFLFQGYNQHWGTDQGTGETWALDGMKVQG